MAKPAPSIQTKNLTFSFPDTSIGLRDISLDLPGNSRTLLIGGKPLSPSLFIRLD